MSDDGKETYEVGYGKPPKQHQFQSGHKKSKGPRKKRRASFTAMFEAEFLAMVPYKVGSKTKSMPAMQLILAQTKQNALKGNEKAVLTAVKLGQLYLPEDPQEEVTEDLLNEAELKVMADILAAKALFGGSDHD